MEDVYFERIAGVGERQGASPRQPQGATQVEPPAEHKGPPVLNMALDDDPPATDYGVESEIAPLVTPQQDIPCDENGFPVSPLRDQEDLWFVQAAALYKPLAKAASTARTSSMFLIVSGALGVLVGALNVDMVVVVVSLIVAVLGTMERGAANDLAQAKRSAPVRLAMNQILVLALVVASSWMSVQAADAQVTKAMADTEQDLVVSDEVTEEYIAQMPAFLQSAARLANESGPTSIFYAVFTVVVIASVLFQGGLALYYFTRGRRIRDFHAELPPWVSEIVTTVAMR